MTEYGLRKLADNEPAGSRIKLGLIGLGVSGMNQKKALDGLALPGDTNFNSGRQLQLVAICDRTPKQIEGVTFTTNYHDLLRDTEIQAVSIVTPPSSHYQIVMEALAAGKHVYTEKPPALTTQQCDEMIEEARKKNKALFFSYHYRYHPLMQRATQELQGQHINGIEITINQNAFVNHDPNGWTFNPAISGGGTLMDDGINFLGVIPQVLNHTPEFGITNTNFTFAPGMQVETAAEIDFRFGQKGRGTVKLDWLNEEKPERKIAFVAGGKTYTVDLLRNVFHTDESILMSIGQSRGDGDKIIEYAGAYDDFARQILSGVPANESWTNMWPLDFVNKAYSNAGLHYPHL